MRPNARKPFRLLSVSAALVITACADGSGPDRQSGPGGLNFHFTGSRSGTFDANGEPALAPSGIPVLANWAVARPDSLGGLVIAGFDPTEGSSGNLFILQISPRQAGNFNCSFYGESGCHGRIFTDVNPDDLSVSGTSYHVVAGNVDLSTVGASSVLGSMQLTLYASDGAGGLNTADAITVSDGAIAVPFADEVVLANGIACLARNLSTRSNQAC
jgi:hypothetical protein